MSTLTVTNISSGSATTTTNNVVNGCAKAWVNFNGNNSPGTIRAQHNVSSVTKNGTGDYTINFTNTLPNADYSVLTTNGNSDGGFTIQIIAFGQSSLSTTSVRTISKGTNGVNFDRDYIGVAVFD